MVEKPAEITTKGVDNMQIFLRSKSQLLWEIGSKL